MDNNDTFRRTRYAFNITNAGMIKIFAEGGVSVAEQDVKVWLTKDIDPDYVAMPDFQLAAFLNGFIIEKRGKREGPQAIPEKVLTNNLILRKFKIALNLKDEDMLEILQLADFKLSKHELSAFFRNPGQSQYRECKDQVLRYFVKGLHLKYREKKSI